VLLDWSLPKIKRVPVKGNKIIFPAATVGRKGIYELREVAAQLQLEITPLGNILEGDNFWQSIATSDRQEYWLDGAALVVLPAYIEDKPRLLLEAIAHQIPVIASTACGLKNIPHVKNIPAGDIHALRKAIRAFRN
jgi:glycosyltransferase involved in cell wall biosynthesis